MAAVNSVVTLARDRINRGKAVVVMSRWQCRLMRAQSSLMGGTHPSSFPAATSMGVVGSGKNLAAMVYPPGVEPV